LSSRNKPWPDLVRDRIRAGKIVERLQDHVEGKTEMTPSQIRAAEILLKKVVPDLSSTEFKGTVESVSHHKLTDNQLATIASGAIITVAAGSPTEPPEVH
jgi:hypothetical protein